MSQELNKICLMFFVFSFLFFLVSFFKRKGVSGASKGACCRTTHKSQELSLQIHLISHDHTDDITQSRNETSASKQQKSENTKDFMVESRATVSLLLVTNSYLFLQLRHGQYFQQYNMNNLDSLGFFSISFSVFANLGQQNSSILFLLQK